MSKLGDIQGLNVHPTPISATVPKFSGSPKDMVLLNQHMITRILFMDFTMIRWMVPIVQEIIRIFADLQVIIICMISARMYPID